MLILLAAAIVAICVLASAQRLVYAAAPTGLDPEMLLQALRGEGAERFARLGAAVAEAPRAEWERELIEALAAPKGEARTARVNEQLLELDFAAKRWERVPRVCASIATSTGILLASMAMRAALTSAEGVDFDRAVADAINVASIGICGGAFCVALQLRAKRVQKARLEATDKLVERLEALSEQG